MVKRAGAAAEVKSDRLSADDVCAIISAAHQHGVSSLKFRELDVTFGHKPESVDQVPVLENPYYVSPVVPQGAEAPPDAEQKQLDLDLMMIENPAEYEMYLQDQARSEEDPA